MLWHWKSGCRRRPSAKSYGTTPRGSTAWPMPDVQPSPPRYVISEFATVSWRDGIVQIASPVTRTTFTTREASLLDLLATFGASRTLIEGEREDVIAEWI